MLKIFFQKLFILTIIGIEIILKIFFLYLIVQIYDLLKKNLYIIEKKKFINKFFLIIIELNLPNKEFIIYIILIKIIFIFKLEFSLFL